MQQLRAELQRLRHEAAMMPAVSDAFDTCDVVCGELRRDIDTLVDAHTQAVEGLLDGSFLEKHDHTDGWRSSFPDGPDVAAKGRRAGGVEKRGASTRAERRRGGEAERLSAKGPRWREAD